MNTLWCKNQENPSDRISHAWAPLSAHMPHKNSLICLTQIMKEYVMLLRTNVFD
jgi:hypothetical protein